MHSDDESPYDQAVRMGGTHARKAQAEARRGAREIPLESYPGFNHVRDERNYSRNIQPWNVDSIRELFNIRVGVGVVLIEVIRLFADYRHEGQLDPYVTLRKSLMQ